MKLYFHVTTAVKDTEEYQIETKQKLLLAEYQYILI